MKELLFKLTLKGKFAGYAYIGDGKVVTATSLEQLEYRKDCASYSIGLMSKGWDEVHPFVCLDRNKERVFEGDKFRSIDYSPNLIGEFYWRDKFPPKFLIRWSDGRVSTPTMGDYNDIELIKEQGCQEKKEK